MKKCLTLYMFLAIMVVASNGVCSMAVPVPVPVPDANGNYVVNGDFESPGDSGWHVYTSIDGWSSTGAGIEIQTNGTLASGFNTSFGTHYVELDSHSNSSMSQSVSLESGKYQFSFWYMPRERAKYTDDNGISYSLSGQNDLSFVQGSQSTFYIDNLAWSKVTMDFAIGEYDGTAFNLTFNAFGKDNSLGGLIDNVSIKAVHTPIPSSMVLLISGFAGFAVLRRKKILN